MEFIVYKKFSDLEQAKEIQELLEKNGIKTRVGSNHYKHLST